MSARQASTPNSRKFARYACRMPVEDYNRRGIEALERAQKAAGIRSAQEFARRLASRTGGPPDGSTYRRWLHGDGAVPAWALIAAAEEAQESLSILLNDESSSTATASELRQLRRTIGRLNAEMIEVRQAIGLPSRSGDEPAESHDRAEAAEGE